MFKFRGKTHMDAMLVIHGRELNPYESVEEVCIESAYPLKDADRIDFITENLPVLELLCAKVHEEHMKMVAAHEEAYSRTKAPTHTVPRTLH